MSTREVGSNGRKRQPVEFDEASRVDAFQNSVLKAKPVQHPFLDLVDLGPGQIV
ncbi:MAG: hypothetical protein ACLP0H_10995 [Terriglobales bacterium]